MNRDLRRILDYAIGYSLARLVLRSRAPMVWVFVLFLTLLVVRSL